MKFWKRLFKWMIIGDSCCGCYLKQTGGRCYRNVNTDLKQTNAYYYSLISFGCFFFWKKLVKVSPNGILDVHELSAEGIQVYLSWYKFIFSFLMLLKETGTRGESKTGTKIFFRYDFRSYFEHFKVKKNWIGLSIKWHSSISLKTGSETS